MKHFKKASLAALALAVAMLGTSCTTNNPTNTTTNPQGYESTTTTTTAEPAIELPAGATYVDIYNNEDSQMFYDNFIKEAVNQLYELPEYKELLNNGYTLTTAAKNMVAKSNNLTCSAEYEYAPVGYYKDFPNDESENTSVFLNLPNIRIILQAIDYANLKEIAVTASLYLVTLANNEDDDKIVLVSNASSVIILEFNQQTEDLLKQIFESSGTKISELNIPKDTLTDFFSVEDVKINDESLISNSLLPFINDIFASTEGKSAITTKAPLLNQSYENCDRNSYPDILNTIDLLIDEQEKVR